MLRDVVYVALEEGFVVIATVPQGVKLAGVGVTDDLILTYSLDTRRPVRTDHLLI